MYIRIYVHTLFDRFTDNTVCAGTLCFVVGHECILHVLVEATQENSTFSMNLFLTEE